MVMVIFMLYLPFYDEKLFIKGIGKSFKFENRNIEFFFNNGWFMTELISILCQSKRQI